MSDGGKTGAPARRRGGLSRRWAFEAEEDPHERRLPAAVRPGDRHELTFAKLQVDALEHALPRPIAEGDILELDG